MAERKLGYFVVCLIDLLGQQRHLSKWSRLPRRGEDHSEVYAGIEQTVGRVEVVREAFLRFHAQHAETLHEAAALPLLEREQFRIENASTLGTLCFSDTLVFWAPMAVRQQLRAFECYQMLLACCSVQLMALSAGFPLRGGVSAAPAMLLKGGDLYGPALERAYRIESKEAEYPRVVVDQKVIEFLIDCACDSHPDTTDMNTFCASKALTFLHEDSDGRWMTDFAGEALRKSHAGAGRGADVELMITKASAFVEASLAHFTEANDEKLIKRYRQLRDYMESRSLTQDRG